MNTKIVLKFASFSLLLVLTIGLAGTASAQSKKDVRKAKSLVEQADKQAGQKNFKAAIDLYAQAIVLNPNYPYAHFQKGKAHYFLKEYEQAITELDIALAQGHPAPEVYDVRWQANYYRGDYDAASADIKLAPKSDSLERSRFLAQISYGKGDYPAALDAFQKAAEATPNNADIFYRIAETQSKLGNVDGQLAAANEAVKRHTQFLGEAYFLIGDAYQKRSMPTEAADAYNRALSAKPDMLAAYRNLAEIYRGQNKFADAIETSRKAIRLFPRNATLYTDISMYYSLADRNVDAIQAAQAAITYEPNGYLAYTNLCRAYNETKQYAMAVNSCNSALKLKPDDGETYFYLGRAYDLLGKTDDATKAYKKAVVGLESQVQVGRATWDVYYLLGNAYFADNQREKAIEAYSKCLELSPRFAKARYNLGIILVLKRDKAGAGLQYNSLLALDQNLAAKLKSEIDKL